MISCLVLCEDDKVDPRDSRGVRAFNRRSGRIGGDRGREGCHSRIESRCVHKSCWSNGNGRGIGCNHGGACRKRAVGKRIGHGRVADSLQNISGYSLAANLGDAYKTRGIPRDRNEAVVC